MITLHPDENKSMFWADIAPFPVISDRPDATRLYCFSDGDNLLNMVAIGSQLCYVDGDSTVQVLATDTTVMSGAAYDTYVADGRMITVLFTTVATAKGCEIVG